MWGHLWLGFVHEDWNKHWALSSCPLYPLWCCQLTSVTFRSQGCIDNLNIQIDQIESELEGLMSKRKKLDKDVSSFSVMFPLLRGCSPQFASWTTFHCWSGLRWHWKHCGCKTWWKIWCVHLLVRWQYHGYCHFDQSHKENPAFVVSQAGLVHLCECSCVIN